MLMIKIFAKFGESNGGKTLLIERIVVASAQEAVQAENQKRLHSGIVRAPDVGDVTGKFARRRVALSSEHSNSPDFRLARDRQKNDCCRESCCARSFAQNTRAFEAHRRPAAIVIRSWRRVGPVKCVAV